jgi:regulator of protease activity HflC (stomatin/prohibitin superfamily)
MSLKKLEPPLWIVAFLLGILFAYLNIWEIVVPFYLLWFIILLIRISVQIVPQYERIVILRMGNCIGAKGPGPVIVLPFIDRAITKDIREQYREIPHESCITKDNARIDVDFLFYYKIKSPELEVTQVQNLQDALGGLATGLLRAVIGDISLDQALAEREHINLQLREKIDEITERWGVEVTTVEIREIVMPPETQEIMTKQMSAERSRRATILEAQGYKEAQMLRADGEATALRMLYDAAKDIDRKTLNLKYLDTLREMGKGASTKYIFPLEFLSLIRPLAEALDAVEAITEQTTGKPPSHSDGSNPGLIADGEAKPPDIGAAHPDIKP